MWKWILIVVVIIVVVAAVYASTTVSQLVDTAAARRGTVSAFVEERATTRLPRTYRITMPIDGRILPIELKEGDGVRVGEIVAQIELSDLDTAVQMAEARVRRLQARIVENNDTRIELSTIRELDSVLESVDRSVEASQAQTEAAKARETYRVTDHQRKKDAFADNAASRKELDEAELAEIESRVDYRADVLALRALEAIREATQIWPLQVNQMIEKKALAEAVLRHELVEAEAALDQARRDRDRAQVRSPVDGIVMRRAVSNLRMLPAGELLLEIGRLDELEIEVEVLSQEAVDITPGDPVDVIVPTVRHEPLQGTVSRVEPRGFTKISSLGVEQQRVLAIVAFDAEALSRFRAEGYSMGVGYRLRVRIFTDAHEDAVAVPRSALFRGPEDRWQAFVVRNGRARKVDLDIGLLNDVEGEVLGGLDAGDEVVLAPDADLHDGARVRPRDSL
ncbi:MAG: efflux RND transporter periplasmic adaptor subunit [Planctomycetota bacterium]|jgi:HlyD family secretion protein